MMVSSGNQISNGSVSFYTTYKAMVDAELTRPPQAEIVSQYRRVGNTLEFEIQVTNQSGTSLSSSNSATVHAVVYEENQILLTGRYVRTAVYTSITPSLANGETRTFTLTTGELTTVDWDKIKSVVFVDYQPGSGAFDMLQADIPELPTFTASPTQVTFMVDLADTITQSTTITLGGASSLNWTAANIPSWLSLSLGSGSLSQHPTVSIIKNNLTAGWQQGQIDFSASDGNELNFEQPVLVQAYYGDVKKIYVPIIQK